MHGTIGAAMQLKLIDRVYVKNNYFIVHLYYYVIMISINSTRYFFLYAHVVRWDYQANNKSELTVRKGQEVEIITQESADMIKVRKLLWRPHTKFIWQLII